MATYDETDCCDGISIVSMRLKVLYTFDGPNRINHLTRWPEALPIRKIVIDHGATVGIVELQICLRAIIEASPELITRTTQDYTIYAHDFSECDYPLVGQGLLSKSMGVTSSEVSSESVIQSNKLITGRVYNDVRGIFTSGVKETLEVKIKLVPVHTALESDQPDLICKVCKYRSLECIESNAFDSIEWNPFILENSSVGEINTLPTSATVLKQRTRSNKQTIGSYVSPDNESSDDSSATRMPIKTSCSSSRTSVKRARDRKLKESANGENASSYEEGSDGDECQASKKRVKLQKAKFDTNSTFVQNPKSLRITAGTSGSLRIFRPTPMDASNPASLLENHEDLSRDSTPLPYGSNEQKIPNHMSSVKSKLRRDSSLSQELSRPIEKAEDLIKYSESMDASSERTRSPFDTDTPPGMTSSPPLIKICSPNRMRSSPPYPSSPSLPLLPRLDPGLMSGSHENISRENEEAIIGGKDTDNIIKRNRVSKRRRNSQASKPLLKQRPLTTELTIEEECPGPMDQLPTKMPIFHQQARAKCAVSRSSCAMSDDGLVNINSRCKSVIPSRRPKSQQQASKSSGPGPDDTSSIGPNEVIPVPPHPKELSEYQALVRTSKDPSSRFIIPKSDPAIPQNSQSCQTSSGGLFSAENQKSKAPPLIQSNNSQPSLNAPLPLTVSQSSSKKEMIKQKLENAIANGEMPPFCCNCGAIETPTWRKAWSKEMKGEPAYYEYSDEPGRVTAIIILTRDAKGKPTSYHLVKKYLGKDENQHDYNEYLLCNPCGIWMSKYKTSRPEERWENNSERASKGEPKKRPTQRVSRSKKVAQGSSYLAPASEASYPPSDNLCPTNDSNDFSRATSSVEGSNFAEPPLQSQVGDVENLNSASLRVLTGTVPPQAVNSSPMRPTGTQQSPIQLEDGLGTTRRLLFSSPSKDWPSKAPLGEARTNPLKLKKESSQKVSGIKDFEKENRESSNIDEEVDPDILKLFGEESTGQDKNRPITPTGKVLEPSSFKTPTRSSPDHRPISRSVTKSIRSAKSPRQTTEVNRTPGSSRQRSTIRKSDGCGLESPFTATLNQLISESKLSMSPLSIRNLDYETLLPGLSEATTASNLDINLNFSLEELFSTTTDITTDDNYNLHKPNQSSPPDLIDFQFPDADPASILNIDDVNEMTWHNLAEAAASFSYEDIHEICPELIKQENSATNSGSPLVNTIVENLGKNV